MSTFEGWRFAGYEPGAETTDAHRPGGFGPLLTTIEGLFGEISALTHGSPGAGCFADP